MGEILGLRWSDVASDLSALHVRRSLQVVAGEFVWAEPKTRKSGRTVELPEPPPGPPEVRLHAVEPTVTIVAEDDFAPKHEIRLIPHADPGVQQVREESRR